MRVHQPQHQISSGPGLMLVHVESDHVGVGLRPRPLVARPRLHRGPVLRRIGHAHGELRPGPGFMIRPCFKDGRGCDGCLHIMMLQHLDITSRPCYLISMRTTLTIDNDLLAAARSLARAQSVSIGQALSELARRGLNATTRIRTGKPGSDFPVFSVPRDAHPLTLEDVQRAEDEE